MKLRHTAMFNLTVPRDDPFTKEFMDITLKAVGSVECVSEVWPFYGGPDSKYALGVQLDFEDADKLDEYMNHPVMLKYTDDYWEKYVKDFLDINFIK